MYLVRNLHAAVTFASLLASSCQGPSPACRALPDCERSFECLAHVCVPTGGVPVAASTERYVIYPSRVRLARQSQSPLELPRSFTLGVLAQDVLLLSFAVDLAATPVERAWIVLYPTRGTAGHLDPVALRLEWQSERGSLPSMPSSRAFSRGENPVRFDVTSALRTQLQAPGETYQAAISVDPGAGTQTFDLLGPGTSPRMELYATPRTRGSRAARP